MRAAKTAPSRPRRRYAFLFLDWGSVGLSRSPRLGTVQRMPIRFENVGIAVRDLEATIA
jgi:hypothetical protein